MGLASCGWWERRTPPKPPSTRIPRMQILNICIRVCAAREIEFCAPPPEILILWAWGEVQYLHFLANTPQPLLQEVRGPCLEKHHLSASLKNLQERRRWPQQCHPPGSPASGSPGNALRLGLPTSTTQGVANQEKCVRVRGGGEEGSCLEHPPHRAQSAKSKDTGLSLVADALEVTAQPPGVPGERGHSTTITTSPGHTDTPGQTDTRLGISECQALGSHLVLGFGGPRAPEQLWVGEVLGSRCVSISRTFLSRPGETSANWKLQKALAQALGRVAQIPKLLSFTYELRLDGGGDNTEGPSARGRESDPEPHRGLSSRELPAWSGQSCVPSLQPLTWSDPPSPCFCSAPGHRCPH